MYQFSASPRSTSTSVSPAPLATTTNGSPWKRNRPRRRQAAANCPSSSSSSSDSDDKDTTSSPPPPSSSPPPPPPSLLHQRKPLQVHLPPPRLSRLNPIENRNSGGGGGGGDEQKRGWFPPSLPRLLPINISPSPSPSPPVGHLAPIQESSPTQKATGSTSSSSDDAPSSPTAPSLSSPTPRTISPTTVQSMPSLIRKGSGQTVQLENEISSTSSSPPPRGSVEVATTTTTAAAAAAAPASSPSQSLGQLLGVKPSANDPAVIAATAAAGAAANNADDPLQFASTEPVHEVAMEGNVAELRRLVKKRENRCFRATVSLSQIQAYSVDYPDHGCRTPLMYAVRGGSKKACEVKKIYSLIN